MCSGVNLNCPRGAVASKKAFMFYLIVKGTKSISRIKIHGPFLFWLENSSIISWLCGSFLSISLSRGANKGKRPQRSPSYFFNTFFNVQDFLIKLGIKPLMHRLEINMFSLNNVLVRPKLWATSSKIRSFKVIFSASKINWIFLTF